MKGFIITGHGNFASGMLSAVNLIVGNPDSTEAVDFLPSDSSETLKAKIEAAIEALNTEETIILCDLLGGTPFKQAVCIKLERQNIEVIAGANLPMIAENLLMRHAMHLENLADHCVETGISGIGKYKETKTKVENASDGI